MERTNYKSQVSFSYRFEWEDYSLLDNLYLNSYYNTIAHAKNEIKSIVLDQYQLSFDDDEIEFSLVRDEVSIDHNNETLLKDGDKFSLKKSTSIQNSVNITVNIFGTEHYSMEAVNPNIPAMAQIEVIKRNASQKFNRPLGRINKIVLVRNGVRLDLKTDSQEFLHENDWLMFWLDAFSER